MQHGFGHTSQVSSSGDSDSPVAGLSELEVALLALLSIRPMTGYEILRHHARALEPWWETPRTQIYPKLRELQRRGLIEHEYVVQESKPNKRLYSIGPGTDKALAALRRFGSDGALASAEQASDLLDAIREVS